MIHDVVKTSTNEHHYALMERETRAMLKRLLENSEDIEKKLRGFVVSAPEIPRKTHP